MWVIIIFFGMLDGTLQAGLASFQFETKDVGSIASLNRRVWEEVWSRWGKVAILHIYGVFRRKAAEKLSEMSKQLFDFPVFNF